MVRIGMSAMSGGLTRSSRPHVSRVGALTLCMTAQGSGRSDALITAFIGERLTTQVLRRAWPTIEETAKRAGTAVDEARQPRHATDHADRCHVEVGTNCVPLRDDQVDRIMLLACHERMVTRTQLTFILLMLR